MGWFFLIGLGGFRGFFCFALNAESAKRSWKWSVFFAGVYFFNHFRRIRGFLSFWAELKVRSGKRVKNGAAICRISDDLQMSNGIVQVGIAPGRRLFYFDQVCFFQECCQVFRWHLNQNDLVCVF